MMMMMMMNVDDFLFGGRNTLADVWPAGQTLDQSTKCLMAAAQKDGIRIDGDIRDALLAQALREWTRDGELSDLRDAQVTTLRSEGLI